MTFLQPFPELFLLFLLIPPLIYYPIRHSPLSFAQCLTGALLFVLFLIRAKYEDWLPCWISLWMSGVLLHLYCWLELVVQLKRCAEWWHQWWIYFSLEYFFQKENDLITLRPFTATSALSIPGTAAPGTAATVIASNANDNERPYTGITSISIKDVILLQSRNGKMHAPPFNQIDWIPCSFRIYLTNPSWFLPRSLSLLLAGLLSCSVVVTLFAQYVLGGDYRFAPVFESFWRLNLTYYTCRPWGEYYAIYGCLFLLVIPPTIFLLDSWRYMRHLWWELASRYLGAFFASLVVGAVAASFTKAPTAQPLAWWLHWSWQLFLLVWLEWTRMIWLLIDSRTTIDYRHSCTRNDVSRVKTLAIQKNQISEVYLYLACEELLRGEPQLLERMMQLFIAPTAPFYVRLSQQNYENLCKLVSGESGEVELVLRAVQRELGGVNQLIPAEMTVEGKC